MNRNDMILTDLYIIDWYDDIITSIINFENKYYLSNCIYKDFRKNEKIYYNVKITKIIFEKIKSMILVKETFGEKEWDYINLVFLKNNKQNNVLFFKTNNLQVGTTLIMEKNYTPKTNNINFPFDIALIYS